MKIRRWSNQNLGHLSCENVAVYMREELFPSIYTTYLSENNLHNNNPPTLQQFLMDYGIKNVSVQTAWRWMRYLGYKYDERKKSYFTDKHESDENIASR